MSVVYTLLATPIALAFLASVALSGSLMAATITEETAFTVKGFDIPIMVVAPESGAGPFPVVYHVHGGGWNGGTDKTVPEASVTSGLRFLTDHTGVIHVGLAYRCKIQGTFQDAMHDLRASVAWFENNAERFNADLTRVGCSGGSAGTPLASLLAQEIPASKTFVGFFGVYDMLNNDESLFPKQEAYEEYGLATDDQKRAASVWHNLRANPPAALLFHGGHDILTHPTQSTRFAQHLQDLGHTAEAIIYPEVNHGYFSERYPIQFKDSVMRIAQLYADHLGASVDLAALESATDKAVAGYFPRESVTAVELVGTWAEKHTTYTFTADGSGEMTFRNRTSKITYTINGGDIMVDDGQNKKILYLQQDGRALGYIPINDVRRTGQRVSYRKRR